VRFHHGLVAIHPGHNGHARLLADHLANPFDRLIVTWGGGTELTATGDTRNDYLTALKQADTGEFTSLIRFARS